MAQIQWNKIKAHLSVKKANYRNEREIENISNLLRNGEKRWELAEMAASSSSLNFTR